MGQLPRSDVTASEVLSELPLALPALVAVRILGFLLDGCRRGHGRKGSVALPEASCMQGHRRWSAALR